jgi:hypothetical protein
MRIRAIAAAFAVVLAAAGSAHAKSAVQITPDEVTILVNKFIAASNEQWVLALNLDDQTLSGNVFNLNPDVPATFFACDATFDPDEFVDLADLASETVTFNCEVASGCAGLPCESWQPIASEIVLPGAFFLP